MIRAKQSEFDSLNVKTSVIPTSPRQAAALEAPSVRTLGSVMAFRVGVVRSSME